MTGLGADRSFPDGLRLGVFSRPLMKLTALRRVLRTESLVFKPGVREVSSLDGVVGWGHKPTARIARQFARDHGLPYFAIEDGFLRSVGLGSQSPPLSLVVDSRGIYYDATGPSLLEDWLAATTGDPLSDEDLLRRARNCRARIVETKISKYNHAPNTLPPVLRDAKRPVVLVVDQTYGDASVDLGQASAEQFSRMLEAACDENPDATILIKTHPDTIAGQKRGYFDPERIPPRALLLCDVVNPIALLAEVDRVYVCTSQLGFEALLLEKPVSCFGVPFYSGWGLTDDRLTCPRRIRKRSLDELVAAALILYPRYLDAFSGERVQVEAVIEHLALQRQMFARNEGSVWCTGISHWKRPFVRRYLEAPGSKVRFFSSAKSLKAALGSHKPRLLTWGNREYEALRAIAEGSGLPLLRMEDGFIRSIGLGSDLTVPGSLVVDSRGIYYDPRSPSDLEVMLQTRVFSEVELEQARRLSAAILATGISKYNTAADRAYAPRANPGQNIVLVPGQVEDDASVRFGSPDVRSNSELILAVRRRVPDAHIIYKPHPDVLSGNRRGKIDAIAESACSEIITDVPLSRCLEAAHEVHTMTSLVGFEALLRQKRVVTYGLPFYAGWGLTQDVVSHERRSRQLTLEELVAGALIVYPRYYNFKALAFCTAEQMVSELDRQRRTGGLPRKLPWLLRRARYLAVLGREMLKAGQYFGGRP